MRVTIKYKAKLSYTRDGCFSKDVYCNVLHEVELQPDGSWKTVNLNWEPYPNEPEENL